jgi:hypothetical protein
MTQGSAGGSAAAGGVGHEGRCLAWAAAHMFAEAPLPSWASGRRVAAVGGQTNRPVDDVGLITDDDGWVTIQAKKGLGLSGAASSPLGEALRQLVDLDVIGVPDGPSHPDALREIDADRDLMLVLTDQSAPQIIDRFLAPVTDRLRDLPAGAPLDDVHRNEGEERAFRLLRENLAQSWRSSQGRELLDSDFRRLTKVLSVRTMRLTDGGPDQLAAQILLTGLTDDVETARRIWQALEREAQRLAEERSFLSRADLVRRLELQGINLRPVARLRADIRRLRDVTQANKRTLASALAIAAPEGPVAVPRTIEPAVMGAEGSLAITGSPGTGKTVLLHGLAAASATTDVDLVVLRSDNLGPTNGQTRIELNLAHDLSEVLAGWTGNRPGLLLIDGLDQTRGMDASMWLPELAGALSETRWRIVATIRTFDLKHGPRWRAMFAGDVVVPDAADPGLAGVRHVVVGDLTDQELLTVRQASPRLARLLDDAETRLRSLLANPFNLDLAGRLLADSDADLSTIRSRVDLLGLYWASRVLYGTGDLDRVRTLQALVRHMLDSGRQAVSPLGLPVQATSAALEALHRNGVLCDLPGGPGSAIGPVIFAHPVLFDYAVAVLALGDVQQPGSVAEVLDHNPNLAITVRPSLDYRLAIAWANDPPRRGFWHLALRLASATSGHLLAAQAAARVVAREMETFADLDELADACTGAASDPDGTWGAAEASGLAFLVAAAIARRPDAQPALDVFAVLTGRLAAQARSTDDVNLALLAAQLPTRAVNLRPGALHTGASQEWTATAVDCMTVALADLGDPNRAPLAQFGGRLLAAVAAYDPHTPADVINAVIAPEALRAWGVVAVLPLIEQIPEISGTAPELAVAIGLAVWEYEETRDIPTSLMDSAILGMTSNRRQDLDGARTTVATKFPTLLDADPSTATELLLRIAELPRMYRGDNSHPAGDVSWLRTADTLESATGDHALEEMTDAFFRKLAQLAETSNELANAPEPRLADQIVAPLLAGLHNSEVWQRLLQRVAKANSPALNQAMLPTLISSGLYAHPDTWLAAGHIAANLSPSLDPQDHLRLEAAILGLVDAGTSNTSRAEIRDHLERRTRMLLNALDAGKTSEAARLRLANHPTGAPDPLPDLPEDHQSPYNFWRGGPEPPTPGSLEDLANRIRTANDQSRNPNPQTRTDGLNRLLQLWDELKNAVAGSGTGSGDPRLANLRVEMAERLAIATDVVPETPLGAEVLATLLDAAPTAATDDEDTDALWSSAAGPAWNLTPSTSATQGLVHLVYRDAWRAAYETELVAALTPLLDSGNPVYRYLSSQALGALHPKPSELIEELDRRLSIESDRHTSAYLMGLLAQATPTNPPRVDQILQRLAALPRWAALTASPSGERTLGPADHSGLAVGLLAILAARHDTPYARRVVTAWLSQPVENPQRVMWTMMRLRELLNPAAPYDRSAQERTFAILAPSLDQLRSVFVQAERSAASSDGLRDRYTRAIKIAEELARQLYYASGAFDQRDPSSPSPSRGDRARFCTLALPLLQGLSAIHYPAITQHIVQIADHLAPVEPKRLLLLAAAAVTGDAMYAREPMGLDTALQLIRHYTADYRGLVLNDPQCTAAIRRVLESFVRLGWDKAIGLAEDLDELFT